MLSIYSKRCNEHQINDYMNKNSVFVWAYRKCHEYYKISFFILILFKNMAITLALNVTVKIIKLIFGLIPIEHFSSVGILGISKIYWVFNENLTNYYWNEGFLIIICQVLKQSLINYFRISQKSHSKIFFFC